MLVNIVKFYTKETDTTTMYFYDMMSHYGYRMITGCHNTIKQRAVP